MTRVLQPSDLRCPFTGKRAYPTSATARAAAQLSWQRPHPRRLTGDMPWRPYLCECGWWHLSSKAPL